MNRWNWAVIAMMAIFAMACSSVPKKEWRKAGLEPNSQVMRDQFAKDRAECATRAGAPTQGGQSTMSYSRAQVGDCLHARGWREVARGE
jgi:hypothetical protein